ncbi:MAG: histidine--tRNA ligase [Candidatus Aenigmarchaeota archaeon]|nr:histidine--tRNA ligase [Candidatus Aenigmarchaeota archaeon]MDI6722586.1 histidine--tRNA ligase [Candidatus Aenigmarchaeota archaeon]
MKKFQPPRGTRDFLPEEMEKRRHVFEKIRQVFESYGFGEVETPAFEELSLLTCKGSLGQEAVKDIYQFRDKAGRELGLRFDITTPVARIAVSAKNMPKPIKFYYITRMWRYDDVSKGRWREFWQAGIELIGSASPQADAEILRVFIDSLIALGLKDFTVRINSRKILDSFADRLKIKNREEIFRIIDKLDKKGRNEVFAELKKRLKEEKAKQVLDFILSPIEEARKISDVSELDAIMSALDEKYRRYVKPDMSIARGLEYYTGFVFETVINGFEGLGSVVGGGRYDSLIERYGGQTTPATGFSIGLERLIEILEKKNLIQLRRQPSVYIAPVNEKFISNAVKISEKLQSYGIKCEYDIMSRSLTKQLDYVNARKIDYVIVVGEKEISSGVYRLRNMKTGEEKEISDLSSLKALV